LWCNECGAGWYVVDGRRGRLVKRMEVDVSGRLLVRRKREK
jgi:hypothetical protein